MNKVTIVAECGVNWKHREEAAEMIANAKLAGADAVKFQCYNQAIIERSPVFESLKEIMLTKELCGSFMEVGTEFGIPVFFTPMYVEAVDFLEELGVDRYKIREKDARHLVSDEGSASAVEPSPLVRRILDTKKPVYISVQRKPLDQYFMYHPNIFFLWCKPEYPARLEDLELWRCALDYGLSCHTPDIMVPVAAASLMLTQKEANRAKIVEVHVSNEPKADYPDGNVSFNFDELKQMVGMIRTLERMRLESPY